MCSIVSEASNIEVPSRPLSAKANEAHVVVVNGVTQVKSHVRSFPFFKPDGRGVRNNNIIAFCIKAGL